MGGLSEMSIPKGTRGTVPVPTKWRCACGHIETPETRCGVPTPWEREDERLYLECQALKSQEESTTRTRRLIPPQAHGTAGGYQYYRCRCDACRGWNADYVRGLRAREARR